MNQTNIVLQILKSSHDIKVTRQIMMFIETEKYNSLSKISNWSPNIFTLVLKVIFSYAKIHASINQPRLCLDSAGQFIEKDWYFLHRRC